MGIPIFSIDRNNIGDIITIEPLKYAGKEEQIT